MTAPFITTNFRSLCWPILAIGIGLAWVGLVIWDYWTTGDHQAGQLISEFQGHGALVCFGLLILSRPLESVLPGIMQDRRWLGLTTFAFALMHTLTSVEHILGGRWDGISFLLPIFQLGVWLGIIALGLMVPLVLTSNQFSIRKLGKYWKQLHLLVYPAAILSVIHGIWIGVHYLGVDWNIFKFTNSLLLLTLTIFVLIAKYFSLQLSQSSHYKKDKL
ncbi:MAG: ferric reductase-like transmembrane domain-containing protein [Gloeobacterales cyanobacterium]